MRKILMAGAALAAIPLVACAHARPEVAGAPPTLHSYILLDRTGSMESIWGEALTSVNTYAQTVAVAAPGERLEAEVSLAVFDSQDGLQFDVLREDVDAKDWRPVSGDEASPRGMTPLYDAIGRIVAMAEADQAEKAVIVIMTDGRENASRELTREGASAALERARERGWEVVFLGAEFAKFDDAEAVGMQRSKTMAVSKDAMAPVMESLAAKSRAYATGAEKPVEFDKEDRDLAEEEDVKRRKGQ